MPDITFFDQIAKFEEKNCKNFISFLTVKISFYKNTRANLAHCGKKHVN